MKFTGAFIVIVIATFSLNFATAKPSTKSLQSDLEDFKKLIPISDIAKLALKYLQEDEEFQAVVEYVFSEDFSELILLVDAIPEYIDFLNYLEKSGLPIYEYVNKLHEILGLPSLKPPKNINQLKGNLGGLRGFLDAVTKLLPMKEIEKLYQEKIKTSPEFKEFIQKIQGKEFQVIVNTLVQNQKFKELIQKARDAGIDVDAVRDFLNRIFGWAIPPTKPYHIM